MPTLDQMFPRAHLTGDDLAGKRHTVTISKVEQRETRPNGSAPVMRWAIHFKDRKKFLYVGKVISQQIIAATGKTNSDDWPGQTIAIYPHPIKVKGEHKIAVRVEVPDAPPTADQHDEADSIEE